MFAMYVLCALVLSACVVFPKHGLREFPMFSKVGSKRQSVDIQITAEVEW